MMVSLWTARASTRSECPFKVAMILSPKAPQSDGLVPAADEDILVNGEGSWPPRSSEEPHGCPFEGA